MSILNLLYYYSYLEKFLLGGGGGGGGGRGGGGEVHGYCLQTCHSITGSAWYLTTGMEKINFSGGEPFIHQKGKFVGELVRYCKEDLKLPSVTIVSNGSLITEEWFQEYGMYETICHTIIVIIPVLYPIQNTRVMP